MMIRTGRLLLAFAFVSAGGIGCEPDAKKGESNPPVPKTEVLKSKDGKEEILTTVPKD